MVPPASDPRTDPFRRNSVYFSNWAKTFNCVSAATYYPSTIEQVQDVVRLAITQKRKLRVFGSGHSPSDLACGPDLMVSIDHVNRVTGLDTTTNTITAEAGISLHALEAHLDSHGLAMGLLGSISDQTLAGVISTSTHGSSLTRGSISTYVRSVDVVLAQPGAPLVHASPTENPDLFKAALCGLGCVGIIVKATVEVEKAFDLEEELFALSFPDFCRTFYDLAPSAQFVRCFWYPQIGEVVISRLNKTTKPRTSARKQSLFSRLSGAVRGFVTTTVIGYYYQALVLLVSKIYPNILPWHCHVMYYLVHRPGPIDYSAFFKWLTPRPTSTEVTTIANKQPLLLPLTAQPVYEIDHSVAIFNYDCGFPQYTYEGVVPYDNNVAVNTLKDIEAFLDTEMRSPYGLRVQFPIEIRFTDADDIWLSPTYQMRGVYIGAIQYRPFGVDVPWSKYFTSLERIFLENSGRPHWAKAHSCRREKLAIMYPKLGEFLKVRERVDPNNTLVNEYIQRHLID